MANTPEDLNKEVKDTANILKDAFVSIGAQIEDIFKRATSANDTFQKSLKKDLVSTLNSLGKNSAQLVDNQYKLNKGQLTSKQIQQQLYDLNSKKEGALLALRSQSVIKGKQLAKYQLDIADYYDIQARSLAEQSSQAEDIERKLGGSANLLKSIGKIPLLGGILDTGKALEAMQLKAADGESSRLDVLKEGFSNIAKKEDLATAALIALGKAGLKANEQTTNLAKSLSQSEYQAAQTRDNLAAMARESGDNFITTEKLVESTLKLGKQLGIASSFSGDLTKEFTTLTKRIGLSEEAAGGLAKASIITGKSLKSIKEDAAGAVSSISAQYGIQLDIKDVLEEAGNSSSLLLANFKGNPVELAKAVAEMKELGTSLETTQKQANELLDFQTSIENTLEASLITGRNINLDKARELALNNDLVGVAQELVDQQVNYNEFGRMNAIQRRSFAKSLGLETEELSDQLLKLEYMGKSRKEITALAGEEAAKRLETLNAQEKFNNAVEKLQDIFVSLIDGPIGQFLGLLTDMLGVIGKIGAAIAKAIPAPILKILAGIGTGAAIGAGFGGIPGAVVGAVSGGVLSGASVALNDDMMSDYGDRTLITPNGSYALNNNDTVIAGTNLFRGNDVYSGPKDSISLSQPEFDYGKLAQAMSQIKVVSVSKPSEFAPFISREQNKAIGVKI
jgi:hypothetical protein